jgi:hypothetical protein
MYHAHLFILTVAAAVIAVTLALQQGNATAVCGTLPTCLLAVEDVLSWAAAKGDGAPVRERCGLVSCKLVLIEECALGLHNKENDGAFGECQQQCPSDAVLQRLYVRLGFT